MSSKCNRYTAESWEECGLRHLLGIPSKPVRTPVALLPEGEGVFQTAEQVQRMMDLTYLPEVIELDVIPGTVVDWSKEPKTVKCAVMYNAYPFDVYDMCEYGIFNAMFLGVERNIPVALKLTAKLDKDGRAIKRHPAEKALDRPCFESERDRPEFWAIGEEGAKVGARLEYLRREAAKFREAQAKTEERKENVRPS
ncbi:MAG: hypothetical protein SEPTF4163_003371 [Sporothrix epigloea]